MDWFDMIQRFYNSGYWTKEQVAQAVVMEKITEPQYEEITGEPYVA